MLEAPYLLRQEEREEERTHARRRPIRHLVLKLGVMSLIILLLLGVVWVIPVASQALSALAEIAPSFVAAQSIL
jgi:cell division septal protein FtsQ